MTRNQILKSIESATKKAEKAARNVDMYIARRDKAIAKANAKGIQVSTTDFHVANPNAQRPTVEMNIRGSFDFNIVYPIMNAWESALENAATEARENRRIAHLNDELAAMDAKTSSTDAMVSILELAMCDFKKEWFGKMTTWHAEHYAHIQAIAPAARERVARLKATKARMMNQYHIINVMCHSFHHARTWNAINNEIRRKSEIIMDNAATLDEANYMEWATATIEKAWTNAMKTMVEKLERFHVNPAAVVVNGIDVTEKGFECIITDGRDRRLYARMIWAAEYSVMVSPHTRYIVTEKH